MKKFLTSCIPDGSLQYHSRSSSTCGAESTCPCIFGAIEEKIGTLLQTVNEIPSTVEQSADVHVKQIMAIPEGVEETFDEIAGTLNE